MSQSQDTQSSENLSWTNILNFLNVLTLKRKKKQLYSTGKIFTGKSFSIVFYS